MFFVFWLFYLLQQIGHVHVDRDMMRQSELLELENVYLFAFVVDRATYLLNSNLKPVRH